MIKETKYVEVVCDRCGLTCANDEYFTVDIYGHSVNGGVTVAGAIRNLATNCGKTFDVKRHYCIECVEKIEKVMKGD